MSVDLSDQHQPVRKKSNTWSKCPGDRFIPFRRPLLRPDFDLIGGAVSDDEEAADRFHISHFLRKTDDAPARKQLLRYTDKRPSQPDDFSGKVLPRRRRKFALPRDAIKVLDAPGIEDDFYVNIMSISARDTIAISLDNTLYTLDSRSAAPVKLYEAFHCEAITGVAWDREGGRLAVGNVLGQVSVWDVARQSEVQSFEAHESRVGALSWAEFLASGSLDGRVLVHDLRDSAARPLAEHKAHAGEVCAVQWDADGQFLASGGNDNRVFAWGLGSAVPLVRGAHKAAVRALGWSPRQHGLFATGGGVSDKTVKVWSVKQAQPVEEREVGSQVCALAFAQHTNDLVTAHGHPGNEISFWRVNGLKKIGSIFGHTERVLHVAFCDRGTNLVSASPDETIRFWHAYDLDAADAAPRVSPPKLNYPQVHLLR